VRHPGPIRTQRYLAAGATTLVGLVALGLALPDNAPAPHLLNDPAHRGGPPFADPLDAMAPWRDFPVGAKVRPMLVFDATDLPVGLRSRPATVQKLVRGRWILPAALPQSIPRMDGYPVLSAAEAVEALHRAVLAEYGQGARTKAGGEPVRVTDVRLSRRTFDTDRGRQSLPAWTIVFDRDIGVPATVLAIRDGDDRLYPSPVPTDAEGDVTLSPDGRRLTYNFLGAAPGAGNCRADYTPVFQETATAVAIGAVEHPHGHNRNGNCRLAAYRRSVSVLLTAPLGNRVAVTYTYGAPLPVRPDGTYRWYRPAAAKH
jgi:hypothetical protein